MKSTKDTFLSWVEISELVDNKEDLNPIDQFLYDWTPEGEDENVFRSKLFEIVNFEDEEITTEHNTKVVSSFMDHCKENGIEIPDSLFESYFDA